MRAHLVAILDSVIKQESLTTQTTDSVSCRGSIQETYLSDDIETEDFKSTFVAQPAGPSRGLLDHLDPAFHRSFFRNTRGLAQLPNEQA